MITSACQGLVLSGRQFYNSPDIIFMRSKQRACEKTHLLSLIITFHNLQGHPIFVESDDCNYFFTWSSSVACPVNTTTSPGCKITDPSTGNAFDLTPLINFPALINGQNGQVYSLGICSVNQLCGTSSQAAACQVLPQKYESDGVI